MNFKRISIIALAILLLFSTNSFAWMLTDATILWIQQDEYGAHIKIDSNKGWTTIKTIDAPTLSDEKNFLAIALSAQVSGINVDVNIEGTTITMIRIVSP